MIHILFLLLGLITVGCVLLITVYLVMSGLPAIGEIGLVDFLFGKEWASTASEPKYGILPFILTSIYGTAGAIVLGVPVGFMTAVYLSKLASPKVRSAMQAAVSLLASIPSVVYGLVGMLVLVPGIRKVFGVPDGASLLAAIIVLAVMILPSIIKMSITALDAVPKEYEDASLALGATPIETYFRVSVPAAKSGIAASVVLGVGRAIGEAMAVMMVAGNVANMPDSLFQSVRFLTTAVASEMAYSGPGSLQRQALFSIALVLFLFIRRQLFLQHTAHLASSIGGCVGSLCFDQIDDRFCLGQTQLTVQKGPLGKFTPLGRLGTGQEQRLQSGGQYSGRAVALDLHRVLAGIAVRTTGVDRHALVNDPAVLIVQQTQHQLPVGGFCQGLIII